MFVRTNIICVANRNNKSDLSIPNACKPGKGYAKRKQKRLFDNNVVVE